MSRIVLKSYDDNNPTRVISFNEVVEVKAVDRIYTTRKLVRKSFYSKTDLMRFDMMYGS